MNEPLEQRLRQSGYLSSPLDSFVLTQKPGGSLPRRIVGIGARSALLIGPLLGTLATLESALMLPALFHRLPDLLIFALYQVCAYTVLFFLFGLLWGCALAIAFWLKKRPVGRPELLWRGFELAGGLFVFSYLALWWASRFADGSNWIENSMAAVLFVALSFFAGRYLGLTGYSVVLQLKPETPLPRFQRHSARFVLGAGLASVFLFTLMLSLAERPSPPLSTQLQPLLASMQRKETRVFMVAIDGLSLSLLEHFSQAGRLPHLQKLLQTSSLAPLELDGLSPIPPVAWTSLATGQKPRGHGVHDFDTRMLYGVRQPLGSRVPALGPLEALQNLMPALQVVDRLPLSSADRHSKAIWEILAESGIKSASLNWWASWPAGKGPALVVSDRLYTRLSLPEDHQPSEHETYPPALFESLAHLAGCCPLPKPLAQLMDSIFGGKAKAALTTAWASDRLMRAAADWIWKHEKPAFLALYFREMDIALRSLSMAHLPELEKTSGLGLFVDASLQDLDAWLGNLAAELEPNSTLLVLGLPSALERERIPSLQGFFLWHGPDAAGIRLPDLTALDVAPTILGFYGLPLSEELAGQPALALLKEQVWAQYPIRRIPSYGARLEAFEGLARSSYDASQIEMMRSLGYIE